MYTHERGTAIDLDDTGTATTSAAAVIGGRAIAACQGTARGSPCPTVATVATATPTKPSVRCGRTRRIFAGIARSSASASLAATASICEHAAVVLEQLRVEADESTRSTTATRRVSADPAISSSTRGVDLARCDDLRVRDEVQGAATKSTQRCAGVLASASTAQARGLGLTCCASRPHDASPAGSSGLDKRPTRPATTHTRGRAKDTPTC